MLIFFVDCWCHSYVYQWAGNLLLTGKLYKRSVGTNSDNVQFFLLFRGRCMLCCMPRRFMPAKVVSLGGGLAADRRNSYILWGGHLLKKLAAVAHKKKGPSTHHCFFCHIFIFYGLTIILFLPPFNKPHFRCMEDRVLVIFVYCTYFMPSIYLKCGTFVMPQFSRMEGGTDSHVPLMLDAHSLSFCGRLSCFDYNYWY